MYESTTKDHQLESDEKKLLVYCKKLVGMFLILAGALAKLPANFWNNAQHNTCFSQQTLPVDSKWDSGSGLFTSSETSPVIHFTNSFSLIIQILSKPNFDIIQYLTKQLLQIYAHVTTAVLSWHMQNFVAMILSQLGWEQNEILYYLKCECKIISEMAAWISCQWLGFWSNMKPYKR